MRAETTWRRPATGLVVLVVLLVQAIAVSTVRAQPSPTATGPVLYRLNATATYEHGCWPPCLCPTNVPGFIRGTLSMTAAGFENGFWLFNVSDVNWLVTTSAGEELRISGSGTYRVGSGILPVMMQQMVLTLRVNTSSVVLDSGLVPANAFFPNLAISVLTEPGSCSGVRIGVNASAVRSSELVPYSLVPGSAYGQGCYPPCACPLGFVPATGRMALVPLPRPAATPSPAREWAVVGIDWTTLSTSPGSAVRARGAGIYRVTSATPMNMPVQRLVVDVRQSGGPTPTPGEIRYDSGWVMVPALPTPAPGSPPPIVIEVADNGFACFNRVWRIKAFSRGGVSFPQPTPSP